MIDEKMYKANVKLVDDNNSLKRDVEILQGRLDKAIEYIEQKEISIIYQEFGLHQENVKNELLEILKGERNDDLSIK